MTQHSQPPLLTVHSGGRDLSQEQADRQWADAWKRIADACETALTTLHPMHPRREELLTATCHARAAAGLPAELRLQSA
jgi:hypothetical protein